MKWGWIFVVDSLLHCSTLLRAFFGWGAAGAPPHTLDPRRRLLLIPIDRCVEPQGAHTQVDVDSIGRPIGRSIWRGAVGWSHSKGRPPTHATPQATPISPEERGRSGRTHIITLLAERRGGGRGPNSRLEGPPRAARDWGRERHFLLERRRWRLEGLNRRGQLATTTLSFNQEQTRTRTRTEQDWLLFLPHPAPQ